jgi:hypothetical protein
MSTLSLQIRTPKSHLEFNKSGQSRQENMARIVNLISGYMSGALESGEIYVSGSTATTLVAASATFTLVSAIATDVITIGTISMTATSTPTTDLHWEIDGASDTLDAASLAAAINANPTLSKVVVATSATNVVTVTAIVKGVVGNQIPVSSADATITASATFLTGGLGGAQVADTQIR